MFYGPVFALYDLALRPLRDVPAMRVMFVLNHLLLAATFVMMIATFVPAPRSRRELILAAFAWVNFFPLVQLIRQNNVEITELALLMGCFLCLKRRRDVAAGGLLGLAIGTKLIPLLLLPYFVWRRVIVQGKSQAAEGRRARQADGSGVHRGPASDHR